MDNDIDLFGQPITEDTPDSHKPRPKRSNAAKGYPAPVGSGPNGETCRSCEHSTATSYHGKRYWKCGLLRHAWTKGLGSDIRLKSPACRHWEAKS